MNTLITFYFNIIYDYFSYIEPKIKDESIFRLLSPLLSIFFGVPNSRIIKSEINQHLKQKELKNIQKLLLKFVRENNLLLN